MKVTIEHNNGFTWIFDTTDMWGSSSSCRQFDNKIQEIIDEYQFKVTNDLSPIKEVNDECDK